MIKLLIKISAYCEEVGEYCLREPLSVRASLLYIYIYDARLTFSEMDTDRICAISRYTWYTELCL